jgi:hypothetical protein
MSKKCSSDLFDLIKSLSKGEKRYFKIFSSRHTIGEENNYIRLFDYIDQMSEYNENEIFKHFEGAAFLNKFSITKSRLYDYILRALESFHSNNSTDAQLFRMLNSADILFSKGLYDLSKKELVSAKKIAEKKQKLQILELINNRVKKLAETYNYSNYSAEEIESISIKDDLLSKEISFQNALWSAKSKLFKLLNMHGQIRSENEKYNFDAIIASLKSVDASTYRNAETKFMENHIRSAYSFAILDEESSLNYLISNHSLLLENPDMIDSDPSRYIALLTNIIHLNRKQKSFDTANLYLNKLKEFHRSTIANQSEDLKIKYFSSLMSLELMIINDSGEYDRTDELAEKIELGIEQFKGCISNTRYAYLYFQLAAAYFGKGDYRKSLKWVNHIINNPQLDDKQDISAFSHILSILIHFELNNDELLPYAMRNAIQFLKKRNRSYKIEMLFLKYMNKLVRTTNYFDRLELFEEIESCMNEISNDPLESVALEYFDFTTWLESKRKQCDFAQLKREKFGIKKAA